MTNNIPTPYDAIPKDNTSAYTAIHARATFRAVSSHALAMGNPLKIATGKTKAIIPMNIDV